MLQRRRHSLGSKGEGRRNSLVGRLEQAKKLDSLVTASLDDRVVLDDDDVRIDAAVLLRHAATRIAQRERDLGLPCTRAENLARSCRVFLGVYPARESVCRV